MLSQRKCNIFSTRFFMHKIETSANDPSGTKSCCEQLSKLCIRTVWKFFILCMNKVKLGNKIIIFLFLLQFSANIYSSFTLYVFSSFKKENAIKIEMNQRNRFRMFSKIYDQKSIFYIFLGIPTIVKTNILIRSMGPVSELDMVRNFLEILLNSTFNRIAKKSRYRITQWIATSG